jgi:CRISPR/Cas system-associated exonuclease Cas4 (RecB family)
MAHAIAARALEEDAEVWEVYNEELAKQPGLPEVSYSDIDEYVQFARRYITMSEVYGIEERLVSGLIPGLSGTVDFWAHYDRHLIVVDFKHGHRKVTDLTQLRTYAVLLEENHRLLIDTVEYVYLQPKAGALIAHRFETAKDLETWGLETLLPGAEKILEGKVSPKNVAEGEWCRYCPRARECPLLTAAFQDMAATIDPALLSAQSLAEAYRMIPAVQLYIAAVEEEVSRRVLAGEEIPTAEIAVRVANREWREESEVRKRFGDRALITKVRSPAQLERIGVKKSEFSDLLEARHSKQIVIHAKTDETIEATRITKDIRSGKVPNTLNTLKHLIQD